MAIDAKRDEVYWQAFAADGSEVTPPAIASVEDARAIALAHDGNIIGSASALLREGAVAGVDWRAGECLTVTGEETVSASTDADLLFAYPGTKRA